MNMHGYAWPLHFQAMKSFKSLINVLNNSAVPPSILCIPCLESTRRQYFHLYRGSGAKSRSHQQQRSYPRCWFFGTVSNIILVWVSQKSFKLFSGVDGVLSQAGGCYQTADCTHSRRFGETRNYGHGLLHAGLLQCWSVVPASLMESCWDRAESIIT